MPKVDSAKRRQTIQVWQMLGRTACRVWYEETGDVSETPYRRHGAAHRAYIDGWNQEVRLIGTLTAPVDWGI
jgi:hypothetical protein